MIMVTDAGAMDGRGQKIVFVNKAFERVTGYTSDEALGQSPRFLQGARTDQGVLEEIRQALAQQQPIRRQLINYKKDGSQYWTDLDIVPIFDATNICTNFAAIERDITAAKKAEARLRRVVDSNAQGVFFWNTQGEISEANDAFLHIVQYSREDLQTGRISWSAMTPPEYANLDRRALEAVAATGVCTPYEKEYFRKDGSRVAILLGAATFEDDPNEGFCFVLDLTERKKLEQQFLRAQRMESIGTLAGGIAHDLNNILAPIIMAIEILKLKATDAQTKGILDTLEVTSNRGADIVRQVLSFAKGMKHERIEIQPKHLLKDIKTIIQDTFPKNIQQELSLPDEIWTIQGDPTQIHQILLNLCVNARDAMPNGGQLTIGVENCVLDEQYVAMNTQAKTGRYVLISVTDSGIGMPPEILDKIFEPFFTTKELHQGTGLGLSTVMAIVKSHDGIINVYSEPGNGSTFKVYLPAMDRLSEERKKQTQRLGLSRGKGETVLVIDDEASIRTITSQTLQAFGYRVLTAADGAEAVAVYAGHQHEIAVVLTDMMMPVMDGPATIHALHRINPGIKIIAASGLQTHSGLTKVTEGSVKHFLSKPYTAQTLLKVVRTIIDEA
jgi:PAS domain S-box-containing protein